MTARIKQMPPHDLEAEQSILGCCFLSADAVAVAMENIVPDDFYKPAHAEIFRAMADLFINSGPIDIASVMGKLMDSGKMKSVGGPAYLTSLLDVVVSIKDVEWHCKRLADKARLRRMIIHCRQVIERCYSGESANEIADFAETGMFEIIADQGEKIKKIDVLIKETMQLLEKRNAADGDITGIETGFYDLDRRLAGLHGGDLLILAGRPSMGKTALAMNIIQNVAVDRNIPSLFFSLEMSGQQLAERVLSGVAVVNGQAMRNGSLVDDDWPKLTAAVGKLSQAPIYIDPAANLSIVDVRARVRRMKSRFGIGLVVIDYLQLMKGSVKGGREQEIAEISRGLKTLAGELDIPVLALCQLNRGVESRTDKRPMLSDLRESGSLEQDADVVMFIYRDEYYHPGRNNENLAELIIGKQRSGPIGTVNLIYQKEISTFRSAI